MQFGIRIADRMMYHIYYCVLLLSQNPRSRKVEPLLVGRRYEYRSLVVHPHFKLIYYINEAKEKIVITNFFDTRKNCKVWQKMLKDKCKG